jgi:glycosyltransferase involved in cell wall biosynthesis
MACITVLDGPLYRGKKVGVVVPAYNEALLIKDTLSGIPGYVSRIYVIDDGSRDRTYEIALSVKDPRIYLIRNEKNSGVGAAIVKGYRLALADDMDVVAVMAGDDQMDPKELPRLIDLVIDGKAGYTKGNRLMCREHRKGMSAWRSFGNWILSVITKIGTGYWSISDPQNGYTAISRKALQSLDLDKVYTYYGYCNDLLAKMNVLGIRVLDVAMPARYGRETSSIRYGSYVRKVAPMIFKCFLWRLGKLHHIKGLRAVTILYAAGMIITVSGAAFCIIALSGGSPVIALALLAAGVASLLLAMEMDSRSENRWCI